MRSDSVIQELEAALYASLQPGASLIQVARLIATTFPDDWPGVNAFRLLWRRWLSGTTSSVSA